MAAYRWEKIFTNSTSNGGIISIIYKELETLDINTPNKLTIKRSTDLNKLSTEESQMAK